MPGSVKQSAIKNPIPPSLGCALYVKGKLKINQGKVSLAQQPLGADEEDQQQDHEGDNILVGTGKISCGQ